MEAGAIVYVDHFQEGNVYEVNNLYETSFPKLTDQYFKVRTTIKEVMEFRMSEISKVTIF